MTSLLTSCRIQHVCWHYKSVFYSDLPQTTINKAINNLRKHLNTRVLARFGHFAHVMWTGLSRLIWHNFVKIGDNWIKICNLAKIRTFNRCIKNRLPILNRLWKNEKMSGPLGGIFLTHTVDICSAVCDTCMQGSVRQTPMYSYLFEQYRSHEVTSSKHCKHQEELRHIGKTYLCLLQSTARQQVPARVHHPHSPPSRHCSQ